jgi:putative sugar O-methyltransferase
MKGRLHALISRLGARFGDHDAIRLQEMASELLRADPIYQPSKYWLNLNQVNTAQLEAEGFRNFKRTLNQNYFNWGPNSLEDNQIRNLLRKWHQEPQLAPLLATLERDHRLLNMFNQNMLDTDEKARAYVFFVGLLWWFASKNDPQGLTARLQEPTIGNPIRVRLGGKLVSQDLANSIREYNVIQHFGIAQTPGHGVVAELGAGYGRLAYVFLVASSSRYLIFDVPPALYVAERYLAAALPKKKVFRFRSFARFSQIEEELNAADIAFFTPNQLALFPPASMDVFISISALHEMRRDQIENFLSIMSATTKRRIYLKNWSRWYNEADGVSIDEQTFRLAPPWKLILDRVDPIQDLFTERLHVRP